MEHVQCVWSDSSLLSSNVSLWLLLPCGILKLNVDAAMFQSAANITMIARNEADCLMKAWAKPFNTSDPLVIESYCGPSKLLKRRIGVTYVLKVIPKYVWIICCKLTLLVAGILKCFVVMLCP